MKETFGEYIHKLRSDNRFTLTKLEAALDIDQSTLSKIEKESRMFPRIFYLNFQHILILT
jgi:transcriptional regulator with XRE-family HTH domain